jgi:hypothetical protein
MKTNRASSVRPPSRTATKATFNLPAFLRSKLRSRAVAVLILLLSGLQFQLFVPTALAQDSTGGKNGTAGKDGNAQQWSVQVDKVDPGDVIIERSFRDAIYENLLEELAKTKQFKQLYRSGDRNAKDVPRLLILKTTVQAYAPGSETRRAVTTVSGATKLHVRIQLLTPEGHQVMEHVVAGNVRFIGSNLRATHNLAHSVAATLKRSTLPETAGVVPEQEPGKVSAFQMAANR